MIRYFGLCGHEPEIAMQNRHGFIGRFFYANFEIGRRVCSIYFGIG